MGLAILAACIPTQGWQRSDRRACAPQSPAVLCLDDATEGLHELRVGERVVLPGECIVAPEDRSGGLRVELHRSGRLVARPRLRVRAGTRTVVGVEGERVEVLSRSTCDDRVDP
ncbi:MAG: hypothetical protein H6712_02295 [Myxococcales bacterium]|nr:hypothetical protein [Myxococcales bacterium]MCB9712658.1 hypothetical protein [Myxococcales bacterium]